MRLIHNSRLAQFRTPFGAVTTGTTLSLSVILEDADPNQATLTLRTWVDEIGESRYPMTHEGDGIFTVELYLQYRGPARGSSGRTAGPHRRRGRNLRLRRGAVLPDHRL